MPFKRILPKTFHEIFSPRSGVYDMSSLDHIDGGQFYIDAESATGLFLNKKKFSDNEIFQIILYPLKIEIIPRFQQAIINKITIDIDPKDTHPNFFSDDLKKQAVLAVLARQYSIYLSKSHENTFFLDEDTPQFTSVAIGRRVFFETDDRTIFIKAIRMFEKDGIISNELAQHILQEKECVLSDQNTMELVKTLLIEPEKNKEILTVIFSRYFSLTAFDEKNGQQELLDLYNHSWVKDNLPFIIGINRYLERLSELNKKELFEFLSQIIFFPWKKKPLLNLFNKLTNIDIFDGGFSNDNWSFFSEKVFNGANLNIFYDHRKTVVQHFIIDEQKKKSKKIKEKNIDQFLSQGWSFFRFQGRTILLATKDSSTVLALKVQKKGEKPVELHKQYETVQFLNKNKKILGLKSQLPMPVCVSKIPGLIEWLEQLKMESVITQNQLNEFLKNIDLTEGEGIVAYVYEANVGYFNYLHDPIFSDQECYEAAFNALNDLLTLLEEGIVYDRLSDLFHNQEKDSEERQDAGRYFTLVNLLRKGAAGGGRLNAFEKAVEFINIGKGGLRDEGDWQPLECFIQPRETLARKFFSETHAMRGEQAGLYITANFIAEYFLVFELAIGRRVLNQIRQQPHLTSLEKTTLWEKGTTILHELYIDGLVKLTALPKDVVRRFFKEACDVKAYAKEMEYWMVPNHYIGDIKNNRVDPSIYAKHTAVTVDVDFIRKGTFNDRVGCSIDGKHPDLGTVNGQYPIKTGECARYNVVTHGFVARGVMQESRKLKELARLTYQKGNLQEAKKYYQEVIALNPFDLLSRKMLFNVCQEISQKTNHVADVLDAKKNKEEKSVALIQRFWRARVEKKPISITDRCKQFQKSR